MTESDKRSTSSSTNPDHYSRYQTQPIDFITESVGPAFIVGNVIKYILRYDAKDGIMDVRKARHYCEFLINYLEGRPPSEDPKSDS